MHPLEFRLLLGIFTLLRCMKEINQQINSKRGIPWLPVDSVWTVHHVQQDCAWTPLLAAVMESINQCKIYSQCNVMNRQWTNAGFLEQPSPLLLDGPLSFKSFLFRDATLMLSLRKDEWANIRSDFQRKPELECMIKPLGPSWIRTVERIRSTSLSFASRARFRDSNSCWDLLRSSSSRSFSAAASFCA